MIATVFNGRGRGEAMTKDGTRVEVASLWHVPDAILDRGWVLREGQTIAALSEDGYSLVVWRVGAPRVLFEQVS